MWLALIPLAQATAPNDPPPAEVAEVEAAFDESALAEALMQAPRADWAGLVQQALDELPASATDQQAALRQVLAALPRLTDQPDYIASALVKTLLTGSPEQRQQAIQTVQSLPAPTPPITEAPPRRSYSLALIATLEPGQIHLSELRNRVQVSQGLDFGIVGIDEGASGTSVLLGMHQRAAELRSLEDARVHIDDNGTATFSHQAPGAEPEEPRRVPPRVACKLLFDDEQMLLHNGCTAESRAEAAARPPTAAPGPRKGLTWHDVDRNGLATYRAGATIGGLGLAVELVGIAIGSPGLVLSGGIGETVGAPVMAGGSLRSRRALTQLGGNPSAAGGATSWVLWSSGLGFAVATSTTQDPTESLVFSVAALGCRVGAYVAAGIQHGVNNRARRKLGISHATVEAMERRTRLQVSVSPWRLRQATGVMLTVAER